MDREEFSVLAEIVSLLQGVVEGLPEMGLVDLTRFLDVLRTLVSDGPNEFIQSGFSSPTELSVVPQGRKRQRAKLRSAPDSAPRKPRFIIATSSDE